jgi:tetratricopeptide (TPR) repeat protein
MANLPDKALVITAGIRAAPELAAVVKTNSIDVLSLEATAYFTKKEPEKAVQVIEAELGKHQTNTTLIMTMARLYADHGRFPDAHATLERQLKLTPEDAPTLINKSVVYVQANDYDAAVQTLNRVLTRYPSNQLARFYRAVAYLRSDKLDAAREDYQALQVQFPKSIQVYFGLGEIAYRQKDTNAAIGNYQAYLTNATSASAESDLVLKRLKELKGEKPPSDQLKGQLKGEKL